MCVPTELVADGFQPGISNILDRTIDPGLSSAFNFLPSSVMIGDNP
jgi:hypothetical protein